MEFAIYVFFQYDILLMLITPLNKLNVVYKNLQGWSMKFHQLQLPLHQLFFYPFVEMIDRIGCVLFLKNNTRCDK